jgi:polar amino acid transport system substrate-binding protein
MQLARLAGNKLSFAPTALLVVALGLVPSAFAQDTGAAPAGASSTVERIRAAGKITLGYYAAARPLSFRNNTGDPDGYGPALCKLVVADLQKSLNVPNLATQFVGVEGDDRFAAVKEGRIDLLCGPAEETLARRADVSFSIAVMDSGTSVMLRKDTPDAFRSVLEGRDIKDQGPLWRGSPQLAALKQRTFVVIAGTSTENRVKEAREKLKVNANITSVPNLEAGIQLLADGRADAFFGERTTLLDANKRDPAAGPLVVLDRYFDHTPLSFALARTDEDFRLAIDRSLSHLYTNGKMADAWTQFFGKPDEAAMAQFDRNALRDD